MYLYQILEICYINRWSNFASKQDSIMKSLVYICSYVWNCPLKEEVRKETKEAVKKITGVHDKEGLIGIFKEMGVIQDYSSRADEVSHNSM